MKKRQIRILAAVAALLVTAALMTRPAVSGTAEYIRPAGGGPAVPSKWDFGAFAVIWNLNPQTGSNVTGSTPVGNVIQAAFNTWQAAPNTAISISRGPDTNSTSTGFNARSASNMNLICFVCSGDFSKDSEALAVTATTIEDAPNQANGHGGGSSFAGQIVDADMLFNPNTTFSTGSGGKGQDLQTVATHEVGHFLGLDHSAVVRAVMFPFAPPSQTTLSYDDVAIISSLYPKSTPDFAAGTISGTVTFASAGPVFGAHVFIDSTSGAEPLAQFNVRKTPIGTYSRPDGSYQITGAPPDSYTVAAEPVDQPVTNKDISDYPTAFGKGSIQSNFTTRYH